MNKLILFLFIICLPLYSLPTEIYNDVIMYGNLKADSFSHETDYLPFNDMRVPIEIEECRWLGSELTETADEVTGLTVDLINSPTFDSSKGVYIDRSVDEYLRYHYDMSNFNHAFTIFFRYQVTDTLADKKMEVLLDDKWGDSTPVRTIRIHFVNSADNPNLDEIWLSLVKTTETQYLVCYAPNACTLDYANEFAIVYNPSGSNVNERGQIYMNGLQLEYVDHGLNVLTDMPVQDTTDDTFRLGSYNSDTQWMHCQGWFRGLEIYSRAFTGSEVRWKYYQRKGFQKRTRQPIILHMNRKFQNVIYYGAIGEAQRLTNTPGITLETYQDLTVYGSIYVWGATYEY